MGTNKATSVNGNQRPHAFFQGAVVPMDEAKGSVTTHALHYGTAVFEGIRGYWNEAKGKMVIKLDDGEEWIVVVRGVDGSKNVNVGVTLG